MKFWLPVLILLNSPLALAAVPEKAPCEHSLKTAKAELAAIYAAEASFHAEYDSYTDGFFEIGYDPAERSSACDVGNWTFSIDRSADEKAFVARAKSRTTGQEVSINEQKEISLVK